MTVTNWPAKAIEFANMLDRKQAADLMSAWLFYDPVVIGFRGYLCHTTAEGLELLGVWFQDGDSAKWYDF